MSRWSQIRLLLVVSWTTSLIALPPRPLLGVVPSEANRRDSEDLADWLDHRFAEQCRAQGVETPAVVDDATFLRRAYLDLLGTIPTVSELRDFWMDSSDAKRRKLVDQLLTMPPSADHLARVWRRVLVPGNGLAATMAATMDPWLSQQFADNVPYDEMTRQLVTAGGASPPAEADSEGESNADPMTSPVAFLRATGGQPATMASSVSRVFLGVRLECAQCHDHPFADWTQEDFWGLAAFFAGSRLGPQQRPGQDNQDNEPVVDQRVTTITPPEGEKSYDAKFPWNNESKVQIPAEKLPRVFFSEWLTSADNPHFAATAVNRIWQHLCGRGLTDSVDDLDQAYEEEREMLDQLAELFVESGFDTRWLIQGICKSKYYQRPSEVTKSAGRALTQRPLKVLGPEQLFNALEVSLALPISSIDQGPRYNGQRDQLVARMSEALGDDPQDFRSGIPQALMLMNGRITADATDLDKSRTLRGVVDAPFLKSYAKIETLFMATLSRRPDSDELHKFMEYVDSQPTDKKSGAYSEIMWALINSPEFVLSR